MSRAKTPKFVLSRKEQVKSWRMRAEELRTVADAVQNQRAGDMLRSQADTWDAMARDAELRDEAEAGAKV